VLELYCEVDGRFPNHHPDPSHPENLKDLIALVQRERSEVGFAFDGDGDRLGVVTAEGKIIFPDRQLMLFAKDCPFAPTRRRDQSTTSKARGNLAPWIREHGGRAEPLEDRSFAHQRRECASAARRSRASMSGHTFFVERWYGFDDAQYAGAAAGDPEQDARRHGRR